jgi:hypothetical protein
MRHLDNTRILSVLQTPNLWCGSAALCLSTCSDNALLSATFVSLTFSTQKNGKRGKAIGYGLSGDPVASPVLSASRRIQYLHTLTSDRSTYLCAIGPTFALLLLIQLTRLLRSAVLSTTNASGLVPSDITAKSLRATGAMALNLMPLSDIFMSKPTILRPNILP